LKFDGALYRARRLLPGLWAGVLLCVALVAAPAPFATLIPADAARVVTRVFAQEAYTSLVLGVLVLLLERRAARRLAAGGSNTQFTAGMALALGAMFCTVAGYFAVLPMMAAVREGRGQGGLTLGQLHALSVAFFAVKTALVLALAWRVVAPPAAASAGTASPVNPAAPSS
jgi:hypothetical protein